MFGLLLNFRTRLLLFLQPTRVVPRKGIEHAIALIKALDNPRCKLVISHESGDEGDEYLNALRDLADNQGVDLRLIPNRIGEERGLNAAGEKVYLLADAYLNADFITYPSLYEGFGNALIEAFYYRKPVLVNRYSIFVSDIEPKGFDVITMNGFMTKDVVGKVRKVIEDPAHRDEFLMQALKRHRHGSCSCTKVLRSYSSSGRSGCCGEASSGRGSERLLRDHPQGMVTD